MNARVLDWDRDLTVYTVGERWREASDALTEGGPLRLELARVEEIDTLGVQLLLMLAREAERAGSPFAIGSVSAPVADALHLLDVALPETERVKETLQ